MGLQQFERRLERLVEGAFTRAFRSGIQPVELGRRVVRELDAGRELGVRGTVAPNELVIRISPEDHDHFEGYVDALEGELADAAREHAREEGYHFLGPVRVTLLADEGRRQGSFAIDARIVEGQGSWACLALPDGRRISLGEEVARIGRLPDCAVILSDPQVSRHHAEIRPARDGYLLVDLGSTNGTLLNGTLVREHTLSDGDEIAIGSTRLRFEEA
jgi:hypothetical protein